MNTTGYRELRDALMADERATKDYVCDIEGLRVDRNILTEQLMLAHASFGALDLHDLAVGQLATMIGCNRRFFRAALRVCPAHMMEVADAMLGQEAYAKLVRVVDYSTPDHHVEPYIRALFSDTYMRVSNMRAVQTITSAMLDEGLDFYGAEIHGMLDMWHLSVFFKTEEFELHGSAGMGDERSTLKVSMGVNLVNSEVGGSSLYIVPALRTISGSLIVADESYGVVQRRHTRSRMDLGELPRHDEVAQELLDEMNKPVRALVAGGSERFRARLQRAIAMNLEPALLFDDGISGFASVRAAIGTSDEAMARFASIVEMTNRTLPWPGSVLACALAVASLRGESQAKRLEIQKAAWQVIRHTTGG